MPVEAGALGQGGLGVYCDTQATLEVVGLRYLPMLGGKLAAGRCGPIMDCTEDQERQLNGLGTAWLSSQVGRLPFLVVEEDVPPTLGQRVLARYLVGASELVPRECWEQGLGKCAGVVPLQNYVWERFFTPGHASRVGAIVGPSPASSSECREEELAGLGPEDLARLHVEKGHGTALEVWLGEAGRKDLVPLAWEERQLCTACMTSQKAGIQVKLGSEKLTGSRQKYSTDAKWIPSWGQNVCLLVDCFDRAGVGGVLGALDGGELAATLDVLLGRMGAPRKLEYDIAFRGIRTLLEGKWGVLPDPVGAEEHASAAERFIQKIGLLADRMETSPDPVYQTLRSKGNFQGCLDHICNMVNGTVLRLPGGGKVVPAILHWGGTGSVPQRGTVVPLASQKVMQQLMLAAWEKRDVGARVLNSYDSKNKGAVPAVGDPVWVHKGSSWAGKRGCWRAGDIWEVYPESKRYIVRYASSGVTVLIGLAKLRLRHVRPGEAGEPVDDGEPGEAGADVPVEAAPLVSGTGPGPSPSGPGLSGPGTGWVVFRNVPWVQHAFKGGPGRAVYLCSGKPCRKAGRRSAAASAVPRCADCLLVLGNASEEAEVPPLLESDEDSDGLDEPMESGGDSSSARRAGGPMESGQASTEIVSLSSIGNCTALGMDAPTPCRVAAVLQRLERSAGGIKARDLVKAGGGWGMDDLEQDLRDNEDAEMEWAHALEEAEAAWHPTIDVVPKPPGRVARGMGIRLTVKPGISGKLRRKVRIVMKEYKGSTQDDSACPTVLPECVKIVVANALAGWGPTRGLASFDMKDAYMHSDKDVSQEHWADGDKYATPPSSLGYGKDMVWKCHVAGFGMVTGAAVLDASVQKRIQQLKGWSCVDGLPGFAKHTSGTLVCWLGDDLLCGGDLAVIRRLREHLEQYWKLEGQFWDLTQKYNWIGRTYQVFKRPGEAQVRCLVMPMEGWDDLPYLEVDAKAQDREGLVLRVRGCWGWWSGGNPIACGLLAGMPEANCEDWPAKAALWNTLVDEHAWVNQGGIVICAMGLGQKVTVRGVTDSGESRFGTLVTVRGLGGGGDWVLAWRAKKHVRVIREIGRGEAFALEYAAQDLARVLVILKLVGYIIDATSILSDSYNSVERVVGLDRKATLLDTPERRSAAVVKELLDRGVLGGIRHLSGEVNPVDWFTKSPVSSSVLGMMLLTGLLWGAGWVWADEWCFGGKRSALREGDLLEVLWGKRSPACHTTALAGAGSKLGPRVAALPWLGPRGGRPFRK
jgi:hypothetical protein